MNKIHVLQTNNPSRLWKNNLLQGKLELSKDTLIGSNTAQHIYITNNQEIKKGDWWFDGTNVRSDFPNSFITGIDKKIILTTDLDLIADGVQAIDDEFLEWFVKNPTCEEVEVGYGWIRLTETNNEGYWVSIPDNQFEMQQEEPKQVTLEEAAENYVRNESDATLKLISKYSFKDGAKYQQERSYSEEEAFNLCRDFAMFVQQKRPSYKKQLEWFEQF